MATTKFVKAYCAKAKQYFALEMKQVGSQWKVANMTHLDSAAASVLSTELEEGVFVTDDSLIPCRTCGNRKVGGCDHSKANHPCKPGMAYQFDCIYCKDFVIDYSEATGASGRAGETVQISQGQEVKIRLPNNRPLKEIFVGVGWDPASGYSNSNMDVDSSVVVLSPNNRESELVYYGDLEYVNGCIKHHGDNLTGDGSGDDENITVDLSRVPQDRDKVVFVLNIFNCYDRHQDLSVVKNLYIRLYDKASKKVLIQYDVEQQNYGRDTAMVIGMAFRRQGEWLFKAIGKTLRVETVLELQEKCKNYL